MIILHAFDEFLRRRMNFFGPDEHFGGSAPAGNQPRSARSFLEIRDVFLDLQRQFVLIFGLLYVRAVQPLYIFFVKRRFHRLDLRQERFYFLKIFVAQHTGLRSGLVSVILEKIPAGENQIVKIGQGDKLLNFWRMVIGALAEADGTELRQRTNRRRLAFANQLHAGHKCRGHRSHSRQQDPKLSLRWRDLSWLFHSTPLFYKRFHCARSRWLRKLAHTQTVSIAQSSTHLQIAEQNFSCEKQDCGKSGWHCRWECARFNSGGGW